MIKLEHVVLPSPEQMEFVIEGIRNPHNSWDKSDSLFNLEMSEDCGGNEHLGGRGINKLGYWAPKEANLEDKLYIGQNDLALMQKLSAAGTDHRKFMRMMPVMVRITAPLYWWKEFDTYKVGTVANSCSTMHKIMDKNLTIEDFSHEHLDNYSRETLKRIIKDINMSIHIYRDSIEHDKRHFDSVVQLLPSSYNQTRNVMLNYEVLANIYHSRKGHKLDEWAEFCEWIERLPYADIITGGKEEC